MSTHAILGMKLPDGSIHGCYVHYDGASMTSRIVDYLKNNTSTGLTMLIAEAQSRGGIRSFHCPPFDSESGMPETDFLDDGEPYIINENNWSEDHLGARYSYLVNYETETVLSDHACKKSLDVV